jgi:hypothetical protein
MRGFFLRPNNLPEIYAECAASLLRPMGNGLTTCARMHGVRATHTPKALTMRYTFGAPAARSAGLAQNESNPAPPPGHRCAAACHGEIRTQSSEKRSVSARLNLSVMAIITEAQSWWRRCSHLHMRRWMGFRVPTLVYWIACVWGNVRRPS